MPKFTLKLQFFKTTKHYPYQRFEHHICHVLIACVHRLSRLPLKPPQPFLNAIVFEMGTLGSKRMKTLNRKTRHQARPTDILSFRLHPSPGRLQRERITGCLLVCPDAIARKWRPEIRHQGIKRVYHRLLIHGFVHLLGFDHHGKREAARMLRVEQFLLNETLGIKKLKSSHPRL